MSLQTLLDFIAAKESRGDANIVWARIRKEDRPKKPLVAMTIREVLAWQDGIDAKYMSEAAGKYQILEDALRGLWKEAGLSLDDLFDEAGQDKLATALLKRRGLDRYMAGKIGAEEFANNLAREWASLPCVSGPKKGRSFYDGDGLNKALVDVKPFFAVVQALKHTPPVRPDVDPPVPTKPQPSGAWWVRAMLGIWNAIFGKWRN